MNLFGKKARPKQPSMQEGIADLKRTMETMEKRELHLQKQADESLNKAKAKSKKGDKRGALFELKRKKMFEKQIENMFGKRVNLETQIMALQSAAANKDVIGAMKTGRDLIREHVNESDIDAVADLMDDIDENVNLVEEMDQALGQPVGALYDDDELEAELNDLEEQMMEEDLVDRPLSLNMPDAPVRKPVVSNEPIVQNESDDDLAALEADLL